MTPDELKNAGIKGFPGFKDCLLCVSIGDALAIWNEFKSKQKPKQSIKRIPGTVWDFCCTNEWLDGIASNSEWRRWLDSGAIRINGCRPKPDEIMPEIITDFVMFPGAKSQRTMIDSILKMSKEDGFHFLFPNWSI